MLYPKEDRINNKLMFACRTCQYSEEAASACVFRNSIYNIIGETAGVTQDVGSDPTVGLPDVCCTLCGQAITCEFCGEPLDDGVEVIQYLEEEEEDDYDDDDDDGEEDRMTTAEEASEDEQLQEAEHGGGSKSP